MATPRQDGAASMRPPASRGLRPGGKAESFDFGFGIVDCGKSRARRFEGEKMRQMPECEMGKWECGVRNGVVRFKILLLTISSEYVKYDYHIMQGD